MQLTSHIVRMLFVAQAKLYLSFIELKNEKDCSFFFHFIIDCFFLND
jgi:hypothetical protein